MPVAQDIHGTVFKNGTATLLARVVGGDGVPLAPADIASASYTIEQIDDTNPDSATPVEGHVDVALAPSEVLLSPLIRDLLWSVDKVGYNLRHVIEIGEHAAFPHAGRRYRVRYTLLPHAGEPIIVRFALWAI